MCKWLVAIAFGVAGVNLLASAVFAFRVVRIRGGERPSWHLISAAHSDLDLTKYPRRAVALAAWHRRCGYIAIGASVVATIVQVVNA